MLNCCKKTEGMIIGSRRKLKEKQTSSQSVKPQSKIEKDDIKMTEDTS